MRLIKAIMTALRQLKAEDKKKVSLKVLQEAHAERFAEYLRIVQDPINYGILDSIVNHARSGVKIIVYHKDGHRFEVLPIDRFDDERIRRPVQAREHF
jgi:hypothetical protein